MKSRQRRLAADTDKKRWKKILGTCILRQTDRKPVNLNFFLLFCDAYHRGNDRIKPESRRKPIPDSVQLRLANVQETLLLPLWGRAVESRKMKPLLTHRRPVPGKRNRLRRHPQRFVLQPAGSEKRKIQCPPRLGPERPGRSRILGRAYHGGGSHPHVSRREKNDERVYPFVRRNLRSAEAAIRRATGNARAVKKPPATIVPGGPNKADSVFLTSSRKSPARGPWLSPSGG